MTVTTAQARYQAELYIAAGTPVAVWVVVSLCDQLDALTLAFETERDAANLYAKQVAHWIEKHDALLEQQIQSTALPDHSEQHLDMVAALPVGELTDEQIDAIAGGKVDYFDRRVFARAILAAARGITQGGKV